MAESAASAPPPRPGPPLIPSPRASSVPAAGFESNLAAGVGAFAGGDFDEAQPAFVSSGGAPSADAGDGPPLEELEAQMRGELAARDESATASPAARRAAISADEDEADGKGVALPEVDALVARLSPEVRETLDELFRARFVSVKKLPKKAFQPAKTKGAVPPSGDGSA